MMGNERQSASERTAEGRNGEWLKMRERRRREPPVRAVSKHSPPTMELHQPIFPKKLPRWKIIPSIIERQSGEVLKMFLFFIFSVLGTLLLFTVTRVKWVWKKQEGGGRGRAIRDKRI